MGDNHHGHAGLGKLFHNIQNFPHHFRVQSGGGFIKKHHIRLHGQGTNNGNTLLLSAGELNGIGTCTVCKPHTVQQLQCLLLSFSLGDALYLDGSDRHILENGFVRKEVKVLEDHAHLLSVQVDVQLFAVGILLAGDIHALKDDGSVRGLLQKIQGAKQGALA